MANSDTPGSASRPADEQVAPSPQPLSVLLIENNEQDAELMLQELRGSGFEVNWKRVETEEEYISVLHESLDVILAEYGLPSFGGLRALKLLRERQLQIPFIVVSSGIGEEIAVAAMKGGSTDYLLKGKLKRLGHAVGSAIAESRLTRDKRKQEEKMGRFRAIVDLATDALEILDPETGRFLDVSEKGASELGYTREEYLMLHVWDVDPTVNPAIWAERKEAIRAAGSSAGETMRRRKDGSLFPVEYHTKWVRLDRDYIVKSSRDISIRRIAELQLRQSEERFRQLAENIHEVFWITDVAKRHVYYVSPAYEQIWGRSCASLYAAPANWLDSIRPEDRARIDAAAVNRNAGGPSDEEYRIVRPDGSERWIRERAFLVREAESTPSRLVGTAEDITERKGLHEKFLQAHRMEAIGSMASGVSHDLNNILAPILIAEELLRETVRVEAEVKLLDIIERCARRASDTVRQLLTFSRGSHGEQVPLQFDNVVNEMVALMRETFPRQISLERVGSGNLPQVVGDQSELHRVILNLCVNARDAMPSGGTLRIETALVEMTEDEVKIHPAAKPGWYVVLRISDTGAGIAPEIAGRIFEPFFSTKGPAQGTGLGLSTALGIVKSHGGFIAVASPPGKGATFTVGFPAVELGCAERAHAAGPPQGTGELILVVEDEDQLRATTSLLLERRGYRVMAARDGTEAVSIYTREKDTVKVVLTDVMMPSMGGVALVRALRLHNPAVRVIATSGLSDPDTEAELKDVGVTSILAKPFWPNDLLAAVQGQLLEGANACLPREAKTG